MSFRQCFTIHNTYRLSKVHYRCSKAEEWGRPAYITYVFTSRHSIHLWHIHHTYHTRFCSAAAKLRMGGRPAPSIKRETHLLKHYTAALWWPLYSAILLCYDSSNVKKVDQTYPWSNFTWKLCDCCSTHAMAAILWYIFTKHYTAPARWPLYCAATKYLTKHHTTETLYY